MQRLTSTVALTVLLWGVGAAPGLARDALAAARSDDYEATIKRGVALRRVGQDREALAEFQRALAIRETAQVLAQIGLAEQALGVWLAAEEHLQKALKGKGDSWIARNEATLRSSLAAIGEHLGSVEIWGEPAVAEVSVNGKPAGTLGASAITRVIAGTCSVLVRADGYEDLSRQLQVEAGGIVRENVQLYPATKRALAPPPAVAAAPTPEGAPAVVLTAPAAAEPEPARTDDAGLTRKWWFWTVLGAVVVGGAATAFLVTRPKDGLACPDGAVCP